MAYRVEIRQVTKARARATAFLFTTLSFVLVHLAFVSPILIPLFSYAGIGPLRAPIVEELFKLMAVIVYRRRIAEMRAPVPIALIAAAVSLGEAFINVILRLSGMIAALDLLPAESDPASIGVLVATIFVAKFLLGTVGHAMTLLCAARLLSDARYVPAYVVMVGAHLLLNLLVA